MIRTWSRTTAGCAVLMAVVLVAAVVVVAEATLIFDLTTTFSGANASGAPQATITELGDGVVEMTLEGNLVATDEFITEWYFNIASNSFGELTISDYNVLVGDVTQPGVSLEGLQADGDGIFSFKLTFQTDANPGRFNDDEKITFKLTDSDGTLTEADFNVASTGGGGAGSFFSAAHIQNIASSLCVDQPGNCTSGWVGDGDGGRNGNGGPPTQVDVPAPAGLLVLGAGLLVVAALGRPRA